MEKCQKIKIKPRKSYAIDSRKRKTGLLEINGIRKGKIYIILPLKNTEYFSRCVYIYMMRVEIFDSTLQISCAHTHIQFFI